MNNRFLDKPAQAIAFDCDGTLTAIEGIDFLAEQNEVGEQVKAVTAKAMSQTGLNPDIYAKRLDWVKPNKSQVSALADTYFKQCVPNLMDVLRIYQRLNKSIYILSAGLYPSVAAFGELLSIPRENIFAVNVTFDKKGQYLDFDHSSPLIHNDGKRIILSDIKKKKSELIYIGDGLNDYAAHDIVTRFIGYGGIFLRENIASKCEFYLRRPSLLALLPLTLTEAEYQSLNSSEKTLFNQGLESLSGC